MIDALRAGAFRLIIALVLITSLILFPILLLWSERRVRWVDLRELHAWTWKRLVRGYP